MAQQEKRILIVTGAGASKKLGREQDMPVMDDWPQRMTKRMGDQLKEAQLNAVKDGREFEAKLGEFLHLPHHVGQLEPFKALGGTDDFCSRFRSKHLQITQAIQAYMHEAFGSDAVDKSKTAAAFGRLVSILDGTPEAIAFATTNYDPCIWYGLRPLRWKLDYGGEPVGPGHDVLRPPEQWAWGSGGGVPCVHLHGAIGWYWKDKEIEILTPQRHVGGNPAFVLPAPNKCDGYTEPILRVWTWFRAILQAATHVLVIGHSLNDALLDEALRQARTARVGIARPSADRDAEGWPCRDWHAIKMQFGPDLEVDRDALSFWLSG